MRYVAGSPEGNRIRRVLLDGKDVTWACRACDDVEGWALIFPHERGEDGRVTILDSEPQVRMGNVHVEFYE